MDDVMKDLMKSLIQHLRKMEAEDKMNGEESEVCPEDLEMGAEDMEMGDEDMDDMDHMEHEAGETDDEEDEEESLQDRMRREMKGSNHAPEAAFSLMVGAPKRGGLDMAKKMARKK